VVEKREYFRVEDVIQLSIKRMPRSQPIPLARQVCYPYNMPEFAYRPEKAGNEELFRLLLSISQKLDLILNYICIEKAGFGDMAYYNINLSAGGISIQTNEVYEIGEKLEIKLVLPTIPPTYLVCYGEVIRKEDSEIEKNKVAIQFINIPEDVRTAIVRYVLNKQRQLLTRG